jgi:tetratricopeptide (TPR) repeat protein
MVGLAMADAATGADIMADDWSARFSAAETILTKVLSLAPNHAQAHLFLGLVQMLTRRIVQGIAECERALVLDRNLATAHGIIGYAKYLLGRGAEVEAHFNEAFRRSPRDALAHRWFVWVGVAKMQLKADTEAVTWLRRALEANQNFPIAHFALAAAPRAARRDRSSAGGGTSRTCARSELYHPPFAYHQRMERQFDFPCRTRTSV